MPTWRRATPTRGAYLVVLAVVFAACGSGAGTSAVQSTDPPIAPIASVVPATPAFSPSPTPQRPCSLTVGAAEVAVPRARLRQLGFFGYPDGIFGTLKEGDKLTWFAAHARPAGPHQRGVPPNPPAQSTIGRVVGTLANPAATEGAPIVPIAGMKAALDYIGGGPIYRDPASGVLLLFYHAERWPAGRSDQFWASYGLAKSTDGGKSWNDLGEFYTPEAPFVDSVPTGTAENARSVPVPAAAYVIVNGYFYVYAKDRPSYDRPKTWLTVARARVTDVIAAAQGNTVSSWSKYYSGAWTEPGLGGKASSLENGNPQVRNSDVAFNQTTNRYVMVIIAAAAADRDSVYLIESSDGIVWGARRIIDESPNLKLFPTIVGLGEDPRVVGPTFNLYYPRNRQNQADTDILKRVVTCM